MKRKKLLALLLVLLMVAAMFAGCGGKKSEEAAPESGAATEEPAKTEESSASAGDEAGDTLVILSSGAFQGAWDPTKNSILSNKHLEYQVLDCLLNYDGESNLTPNIAKEWEYLEDGYTLRIYLNEGVKFHDGSELTAEDVVATMVYMTRSDSARFADYGCQFEGEVVDDYTVDIWPSNEKPLASLLTLLAHDPILSSDDIEAGTLDQGINGTGPYKFVKYENETCYLERFDDYWNPDRAAKTQFCEYKYVAEASTRMAALQSGEAQVIERVDIEQVGVLEADSNVVVDKVLSEEQRYIVYKTTQGPMGNEKLRQALAWAVDSETIANDILQNYGVVADSYVPQVSNLYAPIEDRIGYDMDKAAALLAEAGYPNGEGLPTITYITSTGLYPKSKEIAEFIAASWTSLGLDIDLVVEETAMWESHLYEEASCLITDTGWMNMYGDGNSYLAVHYSTPGRVNFSSYEDIDAIIAKESQITDPEERQNVVSSELFPRLVETCTNYPMYDSVMVYGSSADVAGVTYLPNSNFRFADIYYK